MGCVRYPGLIKDFPRGTTIPLSFTFTTNDGSVIDVTGYKMYVAFSKTKSPGDLDIDLTFLPTDPVNGIIAGEITDTDTLALSPGTYHYSIKYVKTDGSTFPLDIGEVIVGDAIDERVS